MTDTNSDPALEQALTENPPYCPACGKQMTAAEAMTSNVCNDCLNATPQAPPQT